MYFRDSRHCQPVGLKVLLKGRSYHFAEIGADIFFGVLDGGTLFTAHIFRQAMIRFGTRFLTPLTFKTGLSRISGIVGSDRTAQWGARYDRRLGRPDRPTK